MSAVTTPQEQARRLVRDVTSLQDALSCGTLDDAMLVRAQRAAEALRDALCLPAAQTITLERRSAQERRPGPNFVGINGASAVSLPVLDPRIDWCHCWAGNCRCEVVNGRTTTGAHCRAHAQGD